jgi:hypothetical protein
MSARAWGPLDQALQQLREHRLLYRWAYDDLRLWEAACPCCRSGGWDLYVRESYRGAEISLRCTHGCAADEIRAALDREPVHVEVENALRLAEGAADIAARALELAADVSAESVADLKAAA